MKPLASFVGLRDSIATQLLTVVFSIYFIVTLTVTIIHMLAEYYNTKASIVQDLGVFQKMVDSGLANALWNVDTEAVHLSLKGVTQLPTIIGARVENQYGETLEAQGLVINIKGQQVRAENGQEFPVEQTAMLSGVFEHRFDLVYPDLNGPVKVGSAIFYSSSQIVLQKVQYGFMFIIINSIIKTFALWLIFLWVSRYLLSRPLSRLTKATQQLNLETLENLQVDVKTKGRNELKLLEEAFNGMIQKLILAKKRSASLRIFLTKMAESRHTSQLAQMAFEELRWHLSSTHAIQYLPSEGEAHPHNEYVQQQPSCQFLQRPLASELRQQIFGKKDPNVAVYNHPLEHPILAFYAESPDAPNGGHFLYGQSLILEGYWLCFYRKASEEAFDSTDAEYMRSMIHELEIAQANLTSIGERVRMEGELRTAAAVQHALFPRSLPSLANLDLGSFFQSASETGGDWYGFMTGIPNHLFIMIGDVTGHGVPAALVTATASATCRTLEDMYRLQGTTPSPAEFLSHLNRAVFETGSPNFLMTFFIACLNLGNGQLTFSNAGHNFPILLKHSGQVQHLINANCHLGRRPEWEFTEATLQMEQGDLLFFFTDGVIENHNLAGKCWGEHKLVRHLKKYRHLAAKDLVQHIVQEAYLYYDGTPLEDDMTMVACHVTGPFL